MRRERHDGRKRCEGAKEEGRKEEVGGRQNGSHMALQRTHKHTHTHTHTGWRQQQQAPYSNNTSGALLRNPSRHTLQTLQQQHINTHILHIRSRVWSVGTQKIARSSSLPQNASGPQCQNMEFIIPKSYPNSKKITANIVRMSDVSM